MLDMPSQESSEQLDDGSDEWAPNSLPESFHVYKDSSSTKSWASSGIFDVKVPNRNFFYRILEKVKLQDERLEEKFIIKCLLRTEQFLILYFLSLGLVLNPMALFFFLKEVNDNGGFNNLSIDRYMFHASHTHLLLYIPFFFVFFLRRFYFAKKVHILRYKTLVRLAFFFSITSMCCIDGLNVYSHPYTSIGIEERKYILLHRSSHIASLVFGVAVTPSISTWMFFGVPPLIYSGFVATFIRIVYGVQFGLNHVAHDIIHSVYSCLFILITSVYVLSQNAFERRALLSAHKLKEKSKELTKTKRIGQKLLQNLLPKKYVGRLTAHLMKNGSSSSTSTVVGSSGVIFFDCLTNAIVLQTDIVRFSYHAREMSPISIVRYLNFHFSVIENITENHRFSKIATRGDSFVCFKSFEDCENGTYSFESLARLACYLGFSILNFVALCEKTELPQCIQFPSHQIRIALATGNLVTTRFIFDALGESLEKVNRLEQSGRPGILHVCKHIGESLSGNEEFTLEASESDVPYPSSYYVTSSEFQEHCEEFENEVSKIKGYCNSNNNNSQSFASANNTHKRSGESPDNNKHMREIEEVLLENEELKITLWNYSLKSKFGKLIIFQSRNMIEANKKAWKNGKMSFGFLFTYCNSNFLFLNTAFSTNSFLLFMGAFFGLSAHETLYNYGISDKMRVRAFSKISLSATWIVYAVFLCMFFIAGCSLLLSGLNLFVSKRSLQLWYMLMIIFYVSPPIFMTSIFMLSYDLYESNFFACSLLVFLIQYEFSVLVFLPFFTTLITSAFLSTASIAWDGTIGGYMKEFGILTIGNFFILIIYLRKKRERSEHFFNVSMVKRSNKKLAKMSSDNENVLKSVIPGEVLHDFIDTHLHGNNFASANNNLGLGEQRDPVYNVKNGVVIFVDLVNFNFKEMTNYTTVAANNVKEMLNLMSIVISKLDILCYETKVCKIKSCMTKYIAVLGVQSHRDRGSSMTARRMNDLLKKAFEFAIRTKFYLRGMLRATNQFKIGIATGPFICSILGSKNLLFDCFGSTVNFASRLCDSANMNTIQVETSAALEMKSRYVLLKREQLVEVKGFGEVQTYFLVKPKIGDHSPFRKPARKSLQIL